jgi:NADPH-dependent F420 reductase
MDVTGELTVAVIGGTGALGQGLALRWAAAGARVVVGSRAADRAAETSVRLTQRVPGARVVGCENAEAVARADIAVLCVPYASQAPTLKGLRDAWRDGHVLVDATVPLATAVGGRPTELLRAPTGSAAEQAATLVPASVAVVSALHTVSAAHLADLSHRFDEDVLLCGDERDAKARTCELVAAIDGLRPVDCGPLVRSRYIEALTPLLIGVNGRYKVHAGIRLTGVPADAQLANAR